MYTGNVRTADWQRESYQLGAWMDTDNHIKKLSRPLIAHAPAGYTSSFRDPDLIRTDHGYYALIGAHRTTHTARTRVQHYQLMISYLLCIRVMSVLPTAYVNRIN
ncbi:hypothetical protein WP50_21745 [Lactiplantibacillus plantarum]|nr:hypothetical protein WP50_21745 [Lactiplantibacillus plantarum]